MPIFTKPQVIVCGLGRTGYHIFSILKQQDITVVGISEHPIPGEPEDVIVGDVRLEATLLKAGIRDAQTLLLASNDDALNLAVMTQARLLKPQIRIVNRLFNSRLGDRLDHTLPDHLSMSVTSLVAPIFAFAALGNRAIGQLQLFERNWPIEEQVITVDHPWYNLSLQALWENPSRMLIAYQPAAMAMDLVTGVIQGQPLAAGDRLVLSNRPTRKRQRPSLQLRLRRLVSGLVHIRRQGQSMLWVLLALLITIGVATSTYISTSVHISWIDALYFSVGMITGAGGQENVAEQASALIKVFTVVMMIVGAGVIGICYALLNDFILGTHLQQFWTATRVPGGGHHIICGLGGVGVKIVDQLKAIGSEQIAIERDPNGRFLGAVRNQKIPFLIGDASVPDTLRIANIHKATSVLAVTSDDTINLEIAITAKSLEPHLPVLVRVHDPKFARQIQRVFDFDMVMSPTELAAPAFAAAAIGGRIFGNCLTSEGLWIAIATLVTPNHPLYGRFLKEAAATEGFTPLYLEVNDQRVQGQALLDTRLENGVVLYLMMPAKRWKSLWASRADCRQRQGQLS
ncbi:MAG: potassium channel protein [Cyanothece sp. SIO1E1]|nr:potassium channel protein [Cyanothece sp. SIO1E1]